MTARSVTPPARPPVALALLVALLGACGYAAFARGAVGVPQETWLQAAVAVLALVAAAAWLGPGTLRPAASPLALGGLGLLVAFAAWTGASLLWSATPDRTWLELNRVLLYALVVAVAFAAGGAPRAIERVAAGWLVVAVAVAGYALAGKVVPGIVDDAQGIARLRAPLEYWNALGLVCVLGVPPAVRLATGEDGRPARRVAALVALFVLLVCLGLTYSRGGILALVVAVVVTTACGGARLRGLAAFALATLAAAPVLAFAWTDDVLSLNGAALAARIDAGLLLLGVLLAAGAALAGAGWWLVRVERAAQPWPPRRRRNVWLALGLVVAGLALGGVGALAASPDGLRGSLDSAVENFTEVQRDPTFEPGRLLTTSSANRWAWWREAGGAWADEPLAGWGAGSFPVSRRLYRASPSDVLQPHNTPLQFLAETGLVGALLGLGALALLLAGAAARLRALGPGRERDLAGALLAAAAAWCVHACVDWDWAIPGVTVPVLLMLGVLGARAPRERSPGLAVEHEPRPGRLLGLAACGLVACAVLAGVVLPGLSDTRTDAALRSVGDRSPAALERAAQDAALAARLNPLAVRPLFAAAAVAQGRGRLLEARGHLLEAVRRQPRSVEAWTRLTRLALVLADREGVERAAERALALDPGDRDLVVFARRALGIVAPAEASPAATGTPLPAAP